MSKFATHSLWLSATQLSYTLPDGRTPITAIDLSLHHGATGLVGRNGIGKSLLGTLLAGGLTPTSGVIERYGNIAHLRQRVPRTTGTVAHLLGWAAQWDALQRIARGSCDPADFECVGNHWDLQDRLQRWLQHFALDYLSFDDSTARLSGGELARLDLISLLLQAPDHLILDEPSNHLDRQAKRLLSEFIHQWRGGLLLISHDRELLDQMATIYQLDELGLHRYGGNYSLFAQCLEQERETLARQIEQGKAALRRERQIESELRERQQRRQAQGSRERKQANQAKILLDRQRERSDHGSARLHADQHARVQRLSERLQERERRQVIAGQIAVSLPPVTQKGSRCVVELDAVAFGYEKNLFTNLTFHFMAGGRYRISGVNGSGKSTLLRLMAGVMQPDEGRVVVSVPLVRIDQQTSLLEEALTPIENFRRLAPGLGESHYHYRLASMELSDASVSTPVGRLSGGERMKTALACALLGSTAIPLLLLDEPTNHLDLAATLALEQALNDYRGTLIVISHDDHFVRAVGITEELELKKG